MKYNLLFRFLSILLCLLLLLSGCVFASAAVLTFETQYDYEQINKAWLTDLTVKESLTGISDMVTNVTLVAEPDYPYTETPESFKDDVADACQLYSLDENSPRAAYIYLFDVMNQNSALIGDDTSDEEIRQYLIDAGITYPDNSDSDTLVMARALYVVMKSGSLDVYIQNGQMPAGTTLEAAVVSFMSVLTGVDMNAIQEWTTVSDNLSLDEYILAMSKYALWCGGYSVSIDMTKEEVYRLIALMTIRKQGVTAPDNISFEEIKIRYLAAMLGTKYSVSCDADELQTAVVNDTVAFYLLRLMGQDAQLTLGYDSISYEDAFASVAENTDRFDMEVGEFYADVYKYIATLKYKRNSIWLYPTTYVCNNEHNAEMMTITANGALIEDGNFNEIKLNPSLSEQIITIKCTYDYLGEKFATTYQLTVKQGLLNPDSVLVEDPELNDLIDGNFELDSSLYADTYIPNDTDLVGNILGSIGLGVGFGDLLDTFTSSSVGSSSITGSISSIIPPAETNENSALSSMLNNGYLTVLPSVGTLGNNISGFKDTSIKMSVNSMELFSTAEHTDRSNTVLSGIGGLELYSVAESVASVLVGAGTSVENTASPVVSSVIQDLVFDDGETVVGAGVSNTAGNGSNQAYVAALTDKAVSVYANGDNKLAADIPVNQYLSHQSVVGQQNNAENPIVQSAVSNTQKNTSYYALIIAASLAAMAGIVIIVVSKQRKISY